MIHQKPILIRNEVYFWHLMTLTLGGYSTHVAKRKKEEKGVQMQGNVFFPISSTWLM